MIVYVLDKKPPIYKEYIDSTGFVLDKKGIR